MTSNHRLVRQISSFATVVVVASVISVVFAQPAQAYCKISRWRFSSYTMHVRSFVPSTWNTAIQGAMHQWNGIPGSTLQLWGPIFNSGVANPEFLVDYGDIVAWGLQDVPAATVGPGSSGTHTTASVNFNTRWNFNTSGVMNQSTRQVDVRTIAVHEIGHANGLNHPRACHATPTQVELDSVMHPDWRNKPNTNSDDRAGIDSHY